MSFADDPSDHFSLKELYRVRRQSLATMVQDCYDRLLGDPAITILSDSSIIQQHKAQSIEKIVQTLIDSENQLMIAALQSQLRVVKERLNRSKAEAEQKSERQSPEMFRRKLAMLEEQKEQQEEEFRAMLKEYGFEFVNSLQYSLQRVLKEYSFASRGVATREELIKRLYNELGRVNESSSKGSTPSKTIPDGHSNQELIAEVDRLHGLVRTLTDSKDSTCDLLQRKLEDAEHKHSRNIKLLKDSESNYREEIEGRLARAEEEKRRVSDSAANLEREGVRLKEDCGLLRMQLQKATADREELTVRLKELEEIVQDMRLKLKRAERIDAELRKQVDVGSQSKRLLELEVAELERQLESNKAHRSQQISESEENRKRQVHEAQQKANHHRGELHKMQKQNKELRDRLVTALAQLELSQSRPSLRVIAPPEEHQPHIFIAEMQKVCNQRIQQFEKDLEQKNIAIVQLTRQKLQLLRAVETLEFRMSQMDTTNKVSKQESAVLVDDISIILKTLEFQRKLHEQESQHLRKMVSGESTKLGKEIGQLKQLLAQKEAAIKRLQSRKYERRNDKTLQLQELKEQLDRLSNQFRSLQQGVRAQLGAASQIFQLAHQQHPLHNHNRTKKPEYSCIRRQSPPINYTRNLAEQGRYLRYLDSMLDTSSQDEP